MASNKYEVGVKVGDGAFYANRCAATAEEAIAAFVSEIRGRGIGPIGATWAHLIEEGVR